MQINKLKLLFCFLVISSFCLLITAQSKNVEFKQLAGPAEEISTMRLPNPERIGTRSKSAMIPFYGNGELEIPIDNSENFRLMLLSPNASKLNIDFALPNEDFVDARNGVSKGILRYHDKYGLDGNQFPAEVFAFESIKEGNLRVKIGGGIVRNSRKPIGYIVAASDSNYRLYSYIDTFSTVVGKEIGFIGSMFDKNFDNEIDVPVFLNRSIQNAGIRIETPNGEVLNFEMSETESGRFRGSFVPNVAGKYIAHITVRGLNPDGTEYIRTSEQVFTVAGSSVKIGSKVKATMIDDVRWRLDLPVNGLNENLKVVVNGEVWGRNDKGEQVAINWVGGMTFPEKSGRKIYLPITIDSRWLARGNFSDFELRNIRVTDADNSVVIGESSEIKLPYIFATETARTNVGEITEEMRVGVRPINLVKNAPGGKLMLVHGYCSNGVTFPSSQFTNAIVFNDPNQNRTHDQFANLIKNFGAAYPSFGLVAHSQGGAASLHLYTYYWSGLDSATGGSRLIQSVGTPYQGTALAGNLAAIGSVFGAGCGANTNLSYSGAASWLAGIPSWARAKVYYHTTSFTDVWYRYDYCSLATDLFLSDPEDGVVERSYAQLSGANNLGHKTGWCHTTSMRDPGQTTDSSRNSVMNANAAR